MESLSRGLLSSLTFQNPKTHKSTSMSIPLFHNSSVSNSSFNSNSDQTQIIFPKKATLIHRLNTNILNGNFPLLKSQSLFHVYLKSHLSFLCTGLSFPLCCFAADTAVPPEEVPNKINLEAILVSIDDFFNRNPFFVAGVTFIWLVVIPLTEEFFQKYKFISAIDAFRKLRDDPSSQLLDIRDKKSLQYLGSPNLRIVNKSVVQVEFSEGDDEGFVKKVSEKFEDPENTVICILDNFDGNSMKVAELLFKNGFKEAYAIRGGVRGKNGWQAVQESLLPPSAHIYPKKRVKMSQQLEMNGALNEQSNNQAASSTAVSTGQSEKVENGYANKAIESTMHPKDGSGPLSPYPNYPDLKPPSSPSPSKP